ncbi:MAG: MBL fold metallo-hydrolase [Armatimonadetes bacterium]|nr:MBL fold metallo-hydrolase [Armatimonadota bacterium]
MHKVTILDVGHGNCALISDSAGSIVIDGGSHQTLLQYLESANINMIDDVIISHADADHIGGLIDVFLKSKIVVKRVFVNPDALRTTNMWAELRLALSVRLKNKTTEIHTELTSNVSSILTRKSLTVEVLYPSPISAMSGIGGADLDGKINDPNTMSAVVRVIADTGLSLLLPGDIDDVGLDRLIADNIDINARILIYPHHGGLPGNGDISEFVSKICNNVNPELIIFSVGRGKHNNPKPDVIKAIRTAIPDVQIMCTQLSEMCSGNTPSYERHHNSDRVAQGLETNVCCAGSIELNLDTDQIICLPSLENHADFVKEFAPSALCNS